ncbi:MAG: 4-hydroxy-tetrahydrodipicolinate synthase [Bacteroidetes bacterium]|nr:MAG: 4-hydroxy-tetrahydrodipicolinate synthase [Bacteroidota bacterium]
MQNTFQLKGSLVAMITPFKENGAIDFDAFEVLIEDQIKAGTDGIVFCGTTGESPSFTDEEFEAIFSFAAKKCGDRITVIAGTGTNDTHHCVTRSIAAEKCGVDALLVSSPYYNKPTEEGHYQHFAAIANAVDIPIILYNVPGRTAVNMSTRLTLRLANDFENIVAVKEASGNMDQINEILIQRPEGFLVYSGDDALTLPMMICGADGVISVIANAVPAEFRKMVHSCLDGQWETARKSHQNLYRLMQLSMIETNPIPIKTALVEMGKVKEVYRLPMCPMSSADNRAALIEELNKFI